MQFDFRESINKADGRGDGVEASDRKYQTGVSLPGKKQKLCQLDLPIPTSTHFLKKAMLLSTGSCRKCSAPRWLRR